MRTPLELIVRPFVVTPVTSPKQPDVGAVPASTAANAKMNFGSDEVTTWSGSFNQEVSYYYVKKPKEKKKQNGGSGSDYYAPEPDPSTLP